MLRVCSTAPMHGAARYASRWCWLFQANVATRSPAPTPSSRSPRHSRSTRSPTSAYVARAFPASVSVTTSASPFMPRIRSSTSWSVSGWSCCINPSSIRCLLVGLGLDQVALELPVLAVELDDLHRLERIAVVRRGLDLVARQQRSLLEVHVAHRVHQRGACRLLHLLECLGHRGGDGPAVHVEGVLGVGL